MTDSRELSQELEAAVSAQGLSLVECTISQKGKSARVYVVVYSPAGTGIDQCAGAHRAIAAILDQKLGPDSYDLEVSSPGIDRELRNSSEYRLFVGRGLRLWLESGEELAGVLAEADDTHLVLKGGGETQSVPFDQIRKGKLDSSQEGR